MIWVYTPGPGGMMFVGKCGSRTEWERVVAIRRHVLDGQVATVSGLSCPDELYVRFDLEQPWRPPTTRLTMEDHAAAERIAAFGFHVLDGALCRATLAAPGVLLLDRTFTASPPPTWHGHLWLEEDRAGRRDRLPA